MSIEKIYYVSTVFFNQGYLEFPFRQFLTTVLIPFIALLCTALLANCKPICYNNFNKKVLLRQAPLDERSNRLSIGLGKAVTSFLFQQEAQWLQELPGKTLKVQSMIRSYSSPPPQKRSPPLPCSTCPFQGQIYGITGHKKICQLVIDKLLEEV